MKRPYFFGLLVLSLSVPSLYAAGLDVTYMTINKDGAKGVPVTNGQAPSLVYGNGGQGFFFATGGAADNLTRPTRVAPPEERRDTPPPSPRLVEISRRGTVLAALTELIPGSGILIGSRHVLQDNALADIVDSFKAAHLDLETYGARVFEFKNGDSTLDAILFVPQSKVAEIFFPESQESTGLTRYRLKAFSLFERSVDLGDRFHSLQVGTVGNQKTTQMSQGQILAIAPERFLLPLIGEKNVTTIRSSGSLVYVSKSPKEEWKAGGLVECLIPATTSASNVPIPGGVQVLPASELLRAKIFEVSLEDILKEQPTSDPGCIKIDARGGGGG